jgi:ABC-2 type transport system ATP-binding protein
MSAAHVHLGAVTKRFGDREVLLGVDALVQGGVTALLGANGAGKTTLLRCLATIMRPDGGQIAVDGLDPGREQERIEIRRRLGYQPQDVGFNRSATLFDALDYSAVLKEYTDDRQRRHMVFSTLERVGLRDRLADHVTSLSGGMKQRLGLAQAILGRPSLLVLDEPAAGLDPDERQRVREIIAERRDRATVLVSTHLTDDAAEADTVLVLHGGRIAFADSPARLAAVADERTWVQDDLPPPDVRASWRQADGRHRCLGQPHADAELVPPRLEDGYLLVTSR